MGKAINIKSEINLRVSKDIFVLDTNILYWTYYSRCTYSKGYQKDYAPAIISLKAKENKLMVLTISLCELSSIIERNEFNIYINTKGYDEYYTIKDYREVSEERKKNREQLELIYKQIKSFAAIEDTEITRQIIEDYYNSFTAYKLDIYDYVLVDYCKKNNIKNIITDDKDFISVLKDVNIYTANGNYFK